MASNDHGAGKPLRGVNLGGWLVLEKWITPSLFEGLAATDETRFCTELGPAEAARRLRKHWETFITKEDFFRLRDIGIDAVRLPVGHWLYDDYPEHESFGGLRRPYAPGGLEYVDRAFAWAEAAGLQVVLDLHAAPGCQNGFDNGGILGVCDWHRKEEYIGHTLTVLERLAARYGGHPALHGIEALNEPRWDIPTGLLKDFTRAACRRIRRHCPGRVRFIFHDGFRDFREYAGFLQAPEAENTAIDIHRYQCFDPGDTALDIFGHIRKTVVDLREEVAAIERESGFLCCCGEWSLGLDRRVVDLWAENCPATHALSGMDAFQEEAACRAYAGAQLLAFEQCAAWFFWTLRTETAPAWSFLDCVARGFIPGMMEQATPPAAPAVAPRRFPRPRRS